MFHLILQTALLVLAAFVLGAICGCLLHRFLGQRSASSSEAPAISAAPVPESAPAKPKRKTPAESAAAAATATVAATTASLAEPDPEPARPAVADPVELSPAPTPAVVEEMDEAAAEAAIAALGDDATNEDKANAVGVRPAALDAPMGGEKDNLQRIKGIGKVNEGKLNDLGIYHFSQIKDWSRSEARWVGTYLSFSGRIEREDWIGQATTLAAGGETEFAKRVDKGEVSSSSSKKKSKKK